MFEKLTDKLQNAMRTLRGLNKISESNISDALKEVRDALLEADVSFEVVKSFLQDIREKSLGEKVIKSVAPGQQLIKIINDALIELLGGNSVANLSPEKPLRILLAGLHGSGKTTSAVKMALHLQRKGYQSAVVALDVYRPAAIDQLEQLAADAKIPCFANRDSKKPTSIAKEALKWAKENAYDAIIFDTAGRLQIDDELIDEIKDLRKIIEPQEVLLVADSALGQEAVNIAKTFHDAITLSGIVLTKLDGDARGGAALSMKYTTQVPIKFMTSGEHLDDFDVFRAEGMAQRILGMGDIVALVERAHERVDQEEAERLSKKLKKSEFDFDDFLSQMEQIEKMGSMSSLVKLLPGMGNAQISPRELEQMNRTKAMIRAMTKEERAKPQIISGSRKMRIAKGSGVEVKDVNHILKQFENMKKTMKKLKKPEGRKMLQRISNSNALEQLSKMFGPK